MTEETRASIREAVDHRLCTKLASDIMTNLGFEDDEFLQHVLALVPSEPGSRIHLALSLGDNFHIDELPDDETLAKIKEEFRFDCDAGWYMDALETMWVRCL